MRDIIVGILTLLICASPAIFCVWLLVKLGKTEEYHKKEDITCFGCKNLFMNNCGSYECLINAEHACIEGNKARHLYEPIEKETTYETE